MPDPDVNPKLNTSPIFRIRGQRSRWYYPHERLTPEHCEYLRNVNITERGTAARRLGYSTYNSNQITEASVAMPLVGLFQGTWAVNGVQQVECAGTKVYADDGTTRKDITGAFTLTSSPTLLYRFAFIKDKLIATNGTNSAWQWGGDYTTPTNIAAISGAPFTTCEDVVDYRGMLVVLGPTESAVKYPTRVRWPDVDRETFVLDITTWPTANRYEVYDGGPAIVGGCDNFGMLQIFKKDGLYPCQMDYDSNTGYIRFVAPEKGGLIRGFSPVAKCSILARPEFIFVVCAEGAIAIRPDYSIQWVTQDVQSDWLSLNQARLQYAVSRVREKDHQVRTRVSSSGSSTHDLEMVWDWESGDMWFDEYAKDISYATAFRVSGVEYDFLGTIDGYVLRGNTGTSDDSTPFTWEIRMAPNDLGLPGVAKTIVNFKSIYRSPIGQSAIDLRIERDLNTQPSRQRSETLGTSTKWNSGLTWNSGLIWPGGTTTISKYFTNRACENFRPRWRGQGPVELIGYQVDYTIDEPA